MIREHGRWRVDLLLLGDLLTLSDDPVGRIPNIP
jgi:hypothetical protein